MPTLTKIYVIILLMPILSQAQQKFTLNGTVTDASNNETLIGVTIAVPELGIGTTTNEYGFYSLTLPKGNYALVISYLGYQNLNKSLNLQRNVKLDFKLDVTVETLEEVTVTEDAEQLNIRRPQMSVNTLKAETIKQIPIVFGEPDVVRSLVLLPGVTNAGEASSGFNVRGGTVDQNLVLLDEAIVFNTSHLFGLFSIFNPDAIKDLKLYKGGIPSRYGGRVSSVLDIFQKEGNGNEFNLSGGIGITASRILAEGPIKKQESAFLLAARASYAHWFLPLFDIDDRAYFFDINGKANFKLNERNNIYFSGYYGQDLFEIERDFISEYGNALMNFRWNHILSDKTFSNLSMIYSNYFNNLIVKASLLDWETSIENLNAKYDVTYFRNENLTLRTGAQAIYHIFNPGTVGPSSGESGVVEEQFAEKYAGEIAGYVDVEQKVTKKLNVQYGLRLSYFNRLGQDELFLYENDQPVVFDEFTLLYREATPIDTVSSDRGTSLETFVNLEPRASISYAFNDQFSIKASYNRMAQYLQLLSNTSSPTPLDVWAPSGPYIEPQLLDQYAFGFFKNTSDNRYSFELEGFYKDIQNRIDYIDGADLIANDAIEQVILNGEARAYGMEFLFRKNKGKLTGWLAYTLSRSEQRTPGRDPVVDNGRSNLETGINNGNWYKTPFDKTHDIALVASYGLNPKWKLNANFVYQTGQPTNNPVGQFEFEGLTVPFYGPRNETRLPDYHRLDVSATYRPKQKNQNKWQSEWVFGLYNVYNRMNAASINFRQNQDTGRNEAIQTSIFGIVPSISYNFKF